MVCFVAAQWLFVEAQRFGGEGRRGELMVGDCGEVRAKGEEGEPGPLWQGAISHLLTQAHTLTHTYTNAATVTGLSPRRPPPSPSLRT